MSGYCSNDGYAKKNQQGKMDKRRYPNGAARYWLSVENHPPEPNEWEYQQYTSHNDGQIHYI
jgi:hypothetical protein